MFGGPKSTNANSALLNKIKSYSRTNPNSPIYDIVGDSKSWGKAVSYTHLDVYKRQAQVGMLKGSDITTQKYAAFKLGYTW